MRFRYTYTASYEFGSCFTGFIIFLNDGKIINKDALIYKNHCNTYYEINLKDGDYRIVGSRGKEANSAHLCLGSF